MTTDNRRANTKKAIQNAMVTLLKTKSFDDITTTKLAKEAGISRSSFYTHYKDKFELIDSCQQTLFNQIEYIFEKHVGDKEAAFLEIFEFLKREQLLSALISANGTREFQTFIVNKVRLFINTDFQRRFKREKLTPVEAEYLFRIMSSLDSQRKKRITTSNDQPRAQITPNVTLTVR